MERKSPMPGEIYKHFKNKYYQIVGVAKYSENKEKLVVYQALYGDFGMYARPYDMFMSEVDHKKYPDVNQKYRFEMVGRAGEFIELEVKNEDITEDKMIAPIKIEEGKMNQDIENNSNENENPEGVPNPDLMAFLDAETYEEKYKLLASMRPRITDRLINDFAASIDVTVDEGDLETRYRSLLYCVKKMDEFEVTRLR